MSFREFSKKVLGENFKSRYELTCPQCGYDNMFVAPSIFMLSGLNTGCGSCPQCGLFMEIWIDDNNEKMIARDWQESLKDEYPNLDHLPEVKNA